MPITNSFLVNDLLNASREIISAPSEIEFQNKKLENF